MLVRKTNCVKKDYVQSDRMRAKGYACKWLIPIEKLYRKILHRYVLLVKKIQINVIIKNSLRNIALS